MQQKKYNDLKHTEKDLELKIAILFSLEAKRKKEKLDTQLAELQKDLSIKESRVLAGQSSLDQYKTEHEEVISQYESAQKDFYEVGSEIARNEQHLQSLKTDSIRNFIKMFL